MSKFFYFKRSVDRMVCSIDEMDSFCIDDDEELPGILLFKVSSCDEARYKTKEDRDADYDDFISFLVDYSERLKRYC